MKRRHPFGPSNGERSSLPPTRSAAREAGDGPEAWYRGRRVFVTGGAGLVGGWLVARLVELGADVVCLVRDEVPQSVLATELRDQVVIVRGDVCDQLLCERVLGEYEVECVFHLAAQTIVGIAQRNPVSTWESNIKGTWSLLEACRRSPRVGSVVVASSDKAYGAADVLPYSEETPLNARYPYDVSKACADMIATSYAATWSLPVAITRCGNFFGGGDLNFNRIVPGTVRSVLEGERPVIRSDGRFVRDYLYVEDGVDAYLTLGAKLAGAPERFAGRAYNFSSGAHLDVLELVAQILGTMDSPLQPDVRNEARCEIHEQVLDASRAHRELGWQPRYGLGRGLRLTVDWYRRWHAQRQNHVVARRAA